MIQSPSASEADLSFAGFRPADCSLPLRVDDVFASYRDNDNDWADAWQAGLSCPANRRETLLAHIYSEHEPSPLRPQPLNHQSVVPVPRQDQRNRRPQTDCRFFPGIPDHREVRTQVCWPVTSVALGMWSVCRKVRGFAKTSLLRRTSTWLPNTAAQSSTRTPSSPTPRVCRSSSLASSGMPRGPSRAWLLLARSAEPPTRRTPTSRSPTSPHQQRVLQKGGPCASRGCCSSGTSAQARRSAAHLRFQQGC